MNLPNTSVDIGGAQKCGHKRKNFAGEFQGAEEVAIVGKCGPLDVGAATGTDEMSNAMGV